MNANRGETNRPLQRLKMVTMAFFIKLPSKGHQDGDCRLDIGHERSHSQVAKRCPATSV